MKVKELIELLQKEDQEANVELRVQNDDTAWFYLGTFMLDGRYLDIDLNKED
jgi:hypothetical protein